jgi:hypothetical protein
LEWPEPGRNLGIVGGQPNANLDESDRIDYGIQLAHQAVVNIHQLCVIVIFEDELSGPHPSLLSK